MGLTTLELEVGNPANPDLWEKVEFLVDSGTVHSVVLAPVLERLGIRSLSEEEFRLADGIVSPKRALPFSSMGKGWAELM